MHVHFSTSAWVCQHQLGECGGGDGVQLLFASVRKVGSIYHARNHATSRSSFKVPRSHEIDSD